MRYFKMALAATAEQIEENSKVRLKDYSYDSPITAVNSFMMKRMRNGLSFLIYRVEEERIAFAGFSFDEKEDRLEEVYSYITDLLKEIFGIKKIIEEPKEVTMFEYSDCLTEARRRDLSGYTTAFIQSANLWIHDYDFQNSKDRRFDFEEKIVNENKPNKSFLYDSKFKEELLNIENNKNTSGFCGNMVHYVISARSIEACLEMTEELVGKLFRVNRIKSRRIEIITNMEPDLHTARNHMENIIENNYGGTIIFDLTEKLGFDATDYLMVSKFIESLIKKYKKECLFVFTYNMENTGFSYYLLPKLKKYIIPVMLREGTGDRTAAVNYLKALIKDSEYAIYVKQAGEFLKQYPGKSFTQTDILDAFEQFESWAINKNVLQAYSYNVSDDFMLDRNENTASSYDKLQRMIGLNSVKKQIDDIIATNIVEKERKNRQKKNYQSGTMHMVFTGNPGTAKTTVARLFAEIMKDEKVLPTGKFVEVGRADIVGSVVGSTAPLVKRKFREAQGGVLFIDEAYSLCDGIEGGYGDEAINTIVQEMENHRDNVIVIFAGYPANMKQFLDRNPGLLSRIAFHVEFEDYTLDELCDITKLMLSRKEMSITNVAMEKLKTHFESVLGSNDYGNGRFVRKILEEVEMNLAKRVLQLEEEEITKEIITTIEETDIPKKVKKDDHQKRTIGFVV